MKTGHLLKLALPFCHFVSFQPLDVRKVLSKQKKKKKECLKGPLELFYLMFFYIYCADQSISRNVSINVNIEQVKLLTVGGSFMCVSNTLS